MASKRLNGIPGFSIDQVAAAASGDPDVLRLENLDTDLPPPQEAIEATRKALTEDDANSYLPFTGSENLRSAVASRLNTQTGMSYPLDQIVITAGGTEAMLDTLLAIADPDDEVILTDPTYAGMIYRVRLVSAIPRFVPFILEKNKWKLDLTALRNTITKQTRAIFLMNPSMPSGAVLNRDEWEIIAELSKEHSLWLIYNAAMERILFDSHVLIHPAALPGMYERTIVIGSVSKEYRMIGWRIGWIAGPASIMSDIARVHIYNVASAPGIAQAGAAAALRTSDSNFLECLKEWQTRRDVMLHQMKDYPIIPASGGWSMLFDCGALGYDSFVASQTLLEKGKIAATPMRNWGIKNSDQFVRFVFSNEPIPRLSTLRIRLQNAFK
jgi:aspartate/methionine/tyrosine aminotransferase